MRAMTQVLLVTVLCVPAPAAAEAQSPRGSLGSVPCLVPVTGTFTPADGQQAAGVETVTFSIYVEDQLSDRRFG